MAEELDVEAMLEAPYRKEDSRNQSPNGEEERPKRKKRSRERKRSRSRDRKRSRSRERKRSRSREKRRSRERRSSRERGGRYREHHQQQRRQSKSKSPVRKEKSPIRVLIGGKERGAQNTWVLFKQLNPEELLPLLSGKPFEWPWVERQPSDNLSPEERDIRTVFCMQLAARIRPRDLEDFFSAVGKVRDVRMISDRNSRKSKGIAYIEFVEASSVPLAIGLTGQRLLGVPIIVQASQAEKNRAAAAAAAASSLQRAAAGPTRLFVGSLHCNITEDMLRAIFEPFGRIETIQLMMDSETGRSKGSGFITFLGAECAQKAVDQLDGFELAGRPMKVSHVTERSDNDDMQLMARLAEGQHALQMSGAFAIGAMAAVTAAMNPLNMNPLLPAQPLATHCFQLSHMFNSFSGEIPGWETDIQHDVIEECRKHGGVVHIYIDKKSAEGNVYVKCPTVQSAMAAVNSLHGRYFAGQLITASFIPLSAYHQLFPESAYATRLLAPPPRR